jgi:hypothetical protein
MDITGMITMIDGLYPKKSSRNIEISTGKINMSEKTMGAAE